MKDAEQLARLCRRLGADPPQDRLMARKLLQRAGQIAETRGITQLEALQYLLSLLSNAKGMDAEGNSALQKGSGRAPGVEKLNNQQENH